MNQQLTPEVEQWLSIRDEHINQLQEDLTVATAAFKAAQENVRDLTKFRQEYLAQVSKFQQEAKQMEELSAQLAQLRALSADRDLQIAELLERKAELEAASTDTSTTDAIVAQHQADFAALKEQFSATAAAHASMESEGVIHLAKISALENALTEMANERNQIQQKLQVAQHTTREVDAVRQEHVAYVGAFQQKTTQLEQEVQQWQQDYEQLRIQKGGFGFKAMAAIGFVATLIGLAAGYLLFHQRDSNTALFQKFNKAAGFNLEYSLTHGQYDKADKIIADFSKNSAFEPILPEIELIGNLVNAAKLRGDSAVQTSIGYSVVHNDTINGERPKPKRSLVVIHDGAVNVHTEALYNAPVLITLKKRDKIDQWDRTAELDKLRTVNSKGKKGVAEDYWYEVETTDGQKGWLFGFFTNASINRFKPDVPDTVKLAPLPTVIDTAARK